MLNNIFIVIVTFNGMKWLENCLNSTKSCSVIVVDNNSTDGTVEFIKENYPNITLVPNSENLGFGRANNVGISIALEANAEHVFLLNQDAYIDKKSIETLIDFQKRKKEFGVVSPIHLNGKGNRLDQAFSAYVAFRENKDFYSDYILDIPKKEVYEVPFVNAAGWLISKECLETVGGFDPIFFHYGEDENFCQRVKYHGFKVGVVPNVFLRHDREERVKKPVKEFSDDYLKEQEHILKVVWANLNIEPQSIEKIISRKKMVLLKKFIKTLLGGHFVQVAGCWSLKNKLTEWSEDVWSSRRINVKMGKHYL